MTTLSDQGNATHAEENNRERGHSTRAQRIGIRYIVRSYALQ